MMKLNSVIRDVRIGRKSRVGAREGSVTRSWHGTLTHSSVCARTFVMSVSFSREHRRVFSR